MIIFKEKNHSYTFKKERYTSVTTVIKKFTPRFNTKYWSEYKALERLLTKDKFIDFKKKRLSKFDAIISVTPQAFELETKLIKEEWKENSIKATKRGNKYHNEKEKQSYEKGTEFNVFNQKDYKVFKRDRVSTINSSITDNLFDLEDGYYPELVIWNHDYKIAGQADKVYIETDGELRYIDIGDYKTNKKITKSNYFEKMKSPISHLDACHLTKYGLQLSMYGWMLEQFGFFIRDLSFDHINHDNKETRYNVPYLKSEVESLLNYSSS